MSRKKLPLPLREDVVSGGILPDNPEINNCIAEMTALGRAGVPDDIGPMIAAAAIPTTTAQHTLNCLEG